MEKIHIPTFQCGMRQNRYITCTILWSKNQHVLYLHFRSIATQASFHCERKSILHTWKQLVMVLLELNLDWINHGSVIQGKHYLCSTLPELPLLFIFIAVIYLKKDHRTRSCICWTWEHFILGFSSLLDFFFSPLLFLCLLWWVLFYFFFFFLFRAPAWGPKENC